jgi:hypothetical protein
METVKARFVLAMSVVTIGLTVPFCSGQMVSMDPGHLIAQAVSPVKGSTVLNVSSDGAARSIEKIATGLGAHLGKSPRGNTVVNFTGPDLKLDDNCIYPLVNDRTGARGTFAAFAGEQEYLANRPERVGFTGMIDRNSKHKTAPTGDVLLELSFQSVDADHTRLEFWSNCVADTELGRKPANSTGKFERGFLNQLAPGLNLDAWTASASGALDAAAEVDYRARSEFDLADIHRDVLRHLHAGVPERTRVNVQTAASLDAVWQAAQRATRTFAKLRALAVTRTDERFHQIQNGDASVRVGDRPWREEFTTSLSDSGNGKTRITVVRRLLVPSSDGLAWKGYSSDGEMESWLIGTILKELTTEVNKPSARADERSAVEVALVPVAPSVSAADVPVSTATVEVAISSSIDNADVFIDDHFVGNTPLPNYRLYPGSHKIEVKAAGYETWTREMTITPNAATRVSAQLRKQP